MAEGIQEIYKLIISMQLRMNKTINRIFINNNNK